MRMNQQHQQRPNGFSARQKHNNENNSGQQRQLYRHQTSVPKQEFKPVAILKRGDPSGSTATNTNPIKEDNQAKENISANGQQTKTRNYRVNQTNLGFVRHVFSLANRCSTSTINTICTDYSICIKSSG